MSLVHQGLAMQEPPLNVHSHSCLFLLRINVHKFIGSMQTVFRRLNQRRFPALSGAGTSCRRTQGLRVAVIKVVAKIFNITIPFQIDLMVIFMRK